MGGESWFVVMIVLAGGVLLGTLPIVLMLGGRGRGRSPGEARSAEAAPGPADSHRLVAFLHDEVVQLLTGALNNLRLAQRLLDRDHPAAPFVVDGEKMTLAGISAIRELLESLRSGRSGASSLATRVQAVVGWLSHTAPMSVHLAVLPDLSAFPATEEAAAGIIGEALTNAAKHARAANVWVEATAGEGKVTVTVRDDGVGFDPQSAEREAGSRRSFGLYLLRERARSIGGTVDVTSRENGGTTVRAELPLRREVVPLRARAQGWPASGAEPRVDH